MMKAAERVETDSRKTARTVAAAAKRQAAITRQVDCMVAQADRAAERDSQTVLDPAIL